MGGPGDYEELLHSIAAKLPQEEQAAMFTIFASMENTVQSLDSEIRGMKAISAQNQEQAYKEIATQAAMI